MSTDRCEKCGRKSRRSMYAEDANICHKADGPECQAAAVGFKRGHASGRREASTHLRSVINEVCYDSSDDTVDSVGVVVVANAIRFLAASGRIVLVEDEGSRVVGRWS